VRVESNPPSFVADSPVAVAAWRVIDAFTSAIFRSLAFILSTLSGGYENIRVIRYMRL